MEALLSLREDLFAPYREGGKVNEKEMEIFRSFHKKERKEKGKVIHLVAEDDLGEVVGQVILRSIRSDMVRGVNKVCVRLLYLCILLFRHAEILKAKVDWCGTFVFARSSGTFPIPTPPFLPTFSSPSSSPSSSPPPPPPPPLPPILLFFVHPRYWFIATFRGKGIARALLVELLRESRSHKVGYLFLEATTDGASLYKKLGICLSYGFSLLLFPL